MKPDTYPDTRRRFWLDPRAALAGVLAVGLLGAAIHWGSRGLQNFDAALVGYTFGCLFALFGTVYRYSVWVQKPPTRMYWRRAIEIFLTPSLWRNLQAPRILTKSVWSKLIVQDFILKRGFMRWAAHMAIAGGCVLAAAVTFPLVFGWLHFEGVSSMPEPTYKVVAFGFETIPLKINSLIGWATLHALVIASFLVIPGVMVAMYRRLVEEGAIAVQRFGRDLLPLVLLFLISFTGLMLWVSYEFMEGYFYSVMAQIHAFTVIGTLLYLPFGKLFHIFQRPASIGISYYKFVGHRGGYQCCPVTRAHFASKLQVVDLSTVLRQLGFDYSLKKGASVDAWNQYSPQGKRILIGRAHSRLLGGAFSKPTEKVTHG